MLNGAFLITEILCCKALKKLDGSTADVDLVNLDRVRTRDLTKGDKSGDSEANCDRSEGITLRAWKMELA